VNAATAAQTGEWDQYDVYLFDVDGTLLECKDAVHYFAFCSVLSGLAGRPLNLDGVTAHGNTDVGILRDALQLAGVPDGAWRGRLAEIVASLGAHVQAGRQNICATVLPAVTTVLAYLRSREKVLGVATGNLEEVGKLKLGHCDLLSYFDFGAYSDAFEYRVDVFRAAVTRARGTAGASASICVVGDTPADIQAAHANGVDVIAVATGVYPFARLMAEKPEWCLHSLADLQMRSEP
jgi:phosphoglycolate phosphatase